MQKANERSDKREQDREDRERRRSELEPQPRDDRLKRVRLSDPPNGSPAPAPSAAPAEHFTKTIMRLMKEFSSGSIERSTLLKAVKNQTHKDLIQSTTELFSDGTYSVAQFIVTLAELLSD